MSDFIEVTSNSPCPVCGATHWCAFRWVGKKLYLNCHWVRPEIGTIINGYYCFSRGIECGVFETIEQHNRYAPWYSKIKVDSTVPQVKNIIPKISITEEPVKRASKEKINIAYEALVNELKLEKKHQQYLESEGWDLDMMRENQIVSLPPRDCDRYGGGLKSTNLYRVAICQKLIDKGIDLHYVPGFGLNQKGKLTFFGPEGLVIPTRDFSGRITHLRIRPNFTKKDLEWYAKEGKKVPKYINFSSKKHKYGSSCIRGYGVYYSKNNTSICFVTEGEKKGIVISTKRNIDAFILQGVSTYGILLEKDEFGFRPVDYMKKRGIKTVVVCYDHDSSPRTIKNVSRCEEATIELLKNEGFKVATSEWNPNVAKGIDDLIMLGLNPVIKLKR